MRSGGPERGCLEWRRLDAGRRMRRPGAFSRAIDDGQAAKTEILVEEGVRCQPM